MHSQNDPLRVVVHDYAGHPFPVQLSRELSRRGISVWHGYFSDDPGPKGNLSGFSDNPLLQFRGIGGSGRYDKSRLLARHGNDVRYGRAAARLIAEVRPHVVLSGNTPTAAQAPILDATHRIGGAFLYWLQDFYSIAATKILRRKLGPPGAAAGWLYQRMDRRQFRNSDGLVVITDDFRDLAARWAGPEVPIRTVENWGPLPEVPEGSRTENRFAAAHGLRDGFTFLYSGTLGLKHDPMLLVDLAQQFRGRARVVVVAQGLQVDRLRSEGAARGLDNLVLFPLQPIERLKDVLASADVCLGMIDRDAGSFSVPSKVQSYFCAARPVLLSAPTENLAARVVVREAAGLVSTPEDGAGLQANAERLFAEPALRGTMGRNGRRYAEAAYEIGAIADRFEAIFAEARARRGHMAESHPPQRIAAE